MANMGSIVRKNLRDLSNSMEMRELNRQLDWIWKKILGGLNLKDFSDSGIKNVVEVVENTIASELTADEVTTNILKVALAEMMVAHIGVAKIDYAQIVDMFADRVFTDAAIAGKFRAERLEVTQAQIVDLIVNSFRIVTPDGNVYSVSVDTDGNLKTTLVGSSNEWFEQGNPPEGFAPVASSMTIGELTAGTLYVSGAADIMKLTAKYLTVDDAWINELTATTAFIKAITTSHIIGGKSLEMILGEVENASHVFRQEDMPGGSLNIKINDLWVIPSSGEVYQLVAIPGGDEVTFYLDDEGVLSVEPIEATNIYIEDGSLYVDGIVFNMNADGGFSAKYRWVLVQDDLLLSVHEQAQMTAINLEQRIRLDGQGLHIGDTDARSELLIQEVVEPQIHFVIDGVKAGTIGANYHRFGKMEVRTPADIGGIVIQAVDD